MFKQVKQSKAYQDVVDQIQEAIMSGTLRAGCLLPAERELKEQFWIVDQKWCGITERLGRVS